MPPVRIALIGSGIFARDAHLPALLAMPELFDVAAIYSRSTAKAQALADLLPKPVPTYTDLARVLSQADIEAVDILLPILAEPEAIVAALQADKHVISEKPVAADVARGQALLQASAPFTAAGRVWMVAENFRYIPEFAAAGQVLRRGDLGQPIQFCWTIYGNLAPDNKYYHTDWRRAGDFPGGFLLDKGVHNVAAMRTLMGEVASVYADVGQRRPDLPPADTLSATLRFESGAYGVFTMTVAADCPWGDHLHVVGDRGALRIDQHRLEVTVGQKTTAQVFAADTVQVELAEFARAIRQGVSIIATPAEALQDVAVIEAMLASARTGAPVKPQRIV